MELAFFGGLWPWLLETELNDWLSSPVVAAFIAGLFLLYTHFSNKRGQKKLQGAVQEVKDQNAEQEKQLKEVKEIAVTTSEETNGKIQELVRARERLAFMEGLAQGATTEKKRHDDLAATAAELAAEVVIQIDGDQGKILTCNDSVSRLLGWYREELIGKPLTMIIPERYRTSHLKAMTAYIATGKKTMDWASVKVHALTAAKTEVPVEISFSELPTARGKRFIGVIKKRSE